MKAGIRSSEEIDAEVVNLPVLFLTTKDELREREVSLLTYTTNKSSLSYKHQEIKQI